MSYKREVGACFGANLARLRRERNLSLNELAERSGMHRTHISYLINGERLARLDTLIKLACGLEVSIDDLLNGISWKPTEPKGQAKGEFIVGKPK